MVRPRESNLRPPALQSNALPTELILPRFPELFQERFPHANPATIIIIYYLRYCTVRKCYSLRTADAFPVVDGLLFAGYKYYRDSNKGWRPSLAFLSYSKNIPEFTVTSVQSQWMATNL